MNDDDDGVGFDLSAWEAPPPPGGIADAVIAQMRAPDAKPAVEPAPTRKRRGWMIAAPLAAASVIGAVAISLATGGNEDVSGSGAVATAKPSHLELGGTAVDLDANTDVWWVRDGKRMTAMQPRGTATWKVAAGDELVIDAGATVASVKASGASLRVEVEMNMSDARLIGTSAVTAAAVALVTVIVYEGHVNVTSGGKTVEVAAGSTVEIAPDKPPVEPRSAADQIAGLEKRLRSEIDFLKLENELLKKQVAGAAPKVGDLKAFQAVMATLEPAMRRCANGTTINEHFELEIELKSGVATVGWDVEALPQKFASCVDGVIKKAKFSDLEGAFAYTLAIENKVVVTRSNDDRKDSPFLPVKPPSTVDSTPPKCDDKRLIDDTETKADDAYSQGSYALALVRYEQVLRCRRSALTKAYLAACRARAFSKAKVFFNQFSARQDALSQICLKEGFDPRR